MAERVRDGDFTRQVIDHPRVALDRAEPIDHRQFERRPGQRSAQYQRGLAQLGRDVVGDMHVHRHRGAGRHQGGIATAAAAKRGETHPRGSAVAERRRSDQNRCS